jgi:small subunit ribosomal protein S1
MSEQNINNVVEEKIIPNDAEATSEESFQAAFEKTLVSIRPGQIVTGTVVQVTDDEVCLNIGYKSDGIITKNELQSSADPKEQFKIGDEVEVEVIKVNDGEGNVLLSQRSLLVRKNWDKLVAASENGETVTGTGKEVVKGGLIVMVEGVRTFVPASQLSERYVEKIDQFVGQELRLKIIEVDRHKKRLVGSRKAVIVEEAAAKKEKAWENIEEGKIIKGIVRRLTDFGAFVDLGGVDGLIHVTDLSWARVKHPSDVVKPNQEVDVKVLSVDREKERISLGLKQLQPKPWDNAVEKYPVGSIVEGKVVRIVPFGAFIELEPGLDGLVHISQVSPQRIAKVEEVLSIGDLILVKVLDVNPETKRISLSVREAYDYSDVMDEAAQDNE